MSGVFYSSGYSSKIGDGIMTSKTPQTTGANVIGLLEVFGEYNTILKLMVQLLRPKRWLRTS